MWSRTLCSKEGSREGSGIALQVLILVVFAED
jgi:hypothetical protein